MLVSSVAPDGKRYIIGLTKTGPAEGEIRILSWKPKNNSKKPDTDDRTPLYNIRRPAKNTITCLARVFGPDPKVTFNVTPKAIRVTIEGALAGNGTTSYPIDVSEVNEILQFLDSARFPTK